MENLDFEKAINTDYCEYFDSPAPKGPEDVCFEPYHKAVAALGAILGFEIEADSALDDLLAYMAITVQLNTQSVFANALGMDDESNVGAMLERIRHIKGCF